MSDFLHPARRAARLPGVPAHDEGGQRTMSPDGPLRPETGSPLDLLLRRQDLATRTGLLLGYVPAQVR
jgi:hypothetical protein